MTNIPIIKDIYFTLMGILNYKIIFNKSAYWSRDRMNHFQFQRLKTLLINSYDGVPYYKELFKELGFNPITDFNTLEDIKKIPILKKEFVKSNQNIFVNKKFEKKSIPFRTSGSTGVPLEILVHNKQWIIEQAVVWRHWKWGGYNFRDPLAMVRSFIPPSDSSLWKTSIISNFTYFSPFHLNNENMAKYLEIMIKKRIVILRGYPSSLASLADFVLRSGHPIPKVKLILTASEVLTEQDRCKIEKAFNAKVSNHYGLAEQIVMMGDCEKHEGLHNYDEYGYLELIDTNDPKIKRIIGTNLHNLTTPLIRYDTGDLAILSETPCSCGKTLPTIKNIIGRKDAVIKTEEGFDIPTVNFYTMFESFQEIERWQIIQRSINEIDFKIRSAIITKDRLEELELAIRRRLSSSMKVNIQLNVDFIMKNEGKVNPFLSLLAS